MTGILSTNPLGDTVADMNTKPTMPSRLTATRSFTYNVDEMLDSFYEFCGEYPTQDEALDMISEWYNEDLRSPLSRQEVTLIDPETGDEW